MKKVTKKLAISIMILMVAASLAITSTYAWFTMNDTPEVAGFDLEVTSVDGLYISLVPVSGEYGVDATGANGTFKSYLTNEEIMDELLRQFEVDETETLKRLTHGTSVNEKPAFTIEPHASVVGVRDNETAFYSFRIYFRSNNQYEVSLKLATETGEDANLMSSVTTQTASTLPKVQYWTGNELGGTVGDDIEAEAANAVRIAFGNSATAAGMKIWDPNAGEGFGDDYVAADPDADPDPIDGVYENAAFMYYNHVNVDKLTYTAPATAVVDADEVLVTLEETGSTGVYEGFLDVVIWLEGWDGNALNSVLGDIFTTRLVFKGDLVPTP
ncbi:MAG: hypothetical protein WC292_01065 [Clostridia bacterium]